MLVCLTINGLITTGTLEGRYQRLSFVRENHAITDITVVIFMLPNFKQGKNGSFFILLASFLISWGFKQTNICSQALNC